MSHGIISANLTCKEKAFCFTSIKHCYYTQHLLESFPERPLCHLSIATKRPFQRRKPFKCLVGLCQMFVSLQGVISRISICFKRTPYKGEFGRLLSEETFGLYLKVHSYVLGNLKKYFCGMSYWYKNP